MYDPSDDGAPVIELDVMSYTQTVASDTKKRRKKKKSCAVDSVESLQISRAEQAHPEPFAGPGTLTKQSTKHSMIFVIFSFFVLVLLCRMAGKDTI